MGYNDETYSNDEMIKVIIRLMPSGDEVDVDLPTTATGSEVIDALLDDPGLGIKKRGVDGNLITYKLSCKETGRDIGRSRTLRESGVKANFTLLLMPDLVAGNA